jgi:hypothetical protein
LRCTFALDFQPVRAKMKFNLILSAIIALFGYATCKNLKKTENTKSATPQTQDVSESYGWKASRVAGSNADSAGTFQVKAPPRMVKVPIGLLPPASASRKAYLSGGWWNFVMAYQPSDTTVHHNYQPKWMKFREDQTFDILIKGRVVDSGKWAWDETNSEIYLSCNDPYINNTWGIKTSGFTMIWKGNTSINVTGIQARISNHSQLPGG